MKSYIVAAAIGLAFLAGSPIVKAEEYTGHGAIAPSGGMDVLKSDHEKDLEAKEAERKAHWHQVYENGKAWVQTHHPSISFGKKDGDAAGAGTAEGDGAAPAEGDAAADGTDKPKGKWAAFKEKHADEIQAAKDKFDHMKADHETEKGDAPAGESKADAYKEKAHEWADNHADDIQAAKDKWQAWKEKHSKSDQ